MKNDSRYIALSILKKLSTGKRVLDSVVKEFDEKNKRIPRRDRNLLNAIVFGVLRWRGKIDHIINQFSKRDVEKIDDEILYILRIGVFQMLFLNRIPDAAVVNTAVEMTKSSGFPWATGYVNAVLRKVSKEYEQIIFPDKKKDPVSWISSEKSMPTWLMERWLARFGIKETEELCDAINIIPPITIRTNTLKVERKDLIEALKMESEFIDITPYAPHGITFSKLKKPIDEFKPFIDGWFQVQDEAAQLVAPLLDPKPGEMILDACSGLGGKTGHIAQIMNNQGTIIAADVDTQKLACFELETKRLGIKNATTKEVNLERQMGEDHFGKFDRILLDAPCTGLGVLQRNPDIKWAVSKQDFKRYQARQMLLLNNISRLLKPKGILVYAVCSMEPEENEDIINDFLNKNSDFTIDKNSGQLDGKAASLMNKHGFLKTFPHKQNMNGFFIVRLKKQVDILNTKEFGEK